MKNQQNLGIGATILWTIRLLWALGFLAFAGLLVIDLCRIPVSVNSSSRYAAEQTLWRKMSPVEEQRLKELIGHTPVQVLAGFVFGIICAIILY